MKKIPPQMEAKINMISTDAFKRGMSRLEAAFQKKLNQDTLKLYYEKLSGMDADVYLSAVESIIDNDHFFPTIARFREFVAASKYFPD